MYSEKARAMRQCTGTTKDGARCQGWAVWGDELQRCTRHGGVMPACRYRPGHTHYTPCTCPAYAWPHRPGSGLCRWPDAPEYRSTLRPSTHNIAYKWTRRFFHQPSQIVGWRHFGPGRSR